MAHKVLAITLVDDGGSKITDFGKTVLGLNVDRLQVQVTLDGAPTDADVPANLTISVSSHEPVEKRTGKGSMSGTLSLKLRRVSQTLVFFESIALSDLARFMRASDDAKEVATVIRVGGTSDTLFVAPLKKDGWALRGAGVQPSSLATVTTGDMSKERPNARTLFHAGGVEVLEISVDAAAGLDVKGAPTAKVFVRSPADIFFYSGHGAWWDGQLLIDTGGHNYEDWMGPDEVLKFWKKNPDIHTSPMDLDILIINGCSVLLWNKDNEPVDDPDRKSYGLDWAKLLMTKEGPLFAILGYRATAPLDSVRGNTIAAEMGKAAKELGNDWGKYAYKWMQINARFRDTWTAAALDSSQGYYYLNNPGGLGYDKKRPDGAIMGPYGIP